MLESFRKSQVFPHSVIWDFTQTKAFLHQQPPLKMTTELKVITKSVNLEPLLSALSVSSRTAIPKLVTVSQEFLPSPSALLTTDFPWIVGSVCQIGEEFLGYSELLKTAPEALEIPASPMPLKVPRETEWVTPTSSLPFLPVFNALGAFLGVSEKKRSVFLLPEILETLRVLGQPLTEATRRKKQALEDALQDLERHISDLLLPRPAPAGAILVRGVPTPTKPARDRGKQPSAIRASVLSQRWEPERRLSLPIIHEPVLNKGCLTLSVRVDDPELVGRLAHLVLVTEEAEVVLASARIEAKGEIAELMFDVDLTSAGLRLKDGVFPIHIIQIIIEPKPTPEGSKGSQDAP